MAGYREPSHSYKVKIQSLEDGKREREGTRKKEKKERQTKRLTDPGSGALWPIKSELFSFAVTSGREYVR